MKIEVSGYQEFTRSTAIYPRYSDKEALAYLGLGLTGEAGEVAEKIKKYIRDSTFDEEAFIKELGDVFWYLARICDEMGVTMESVMLRNIRKLQDRQERDKLGGNGDSR